MRAVSDTSPISNLASIGRLDLLKPQLPEIWIPTAVARELENLKAGVVLIDEQEGRQYAAQGGLSVSGVLGVLLLARRNGTIQILRPEIESLRSKARFFIAASLEASVLAAAGE